MNAAEVWTLFEEHFKAPTPAELDAMADEYQREQIASAQSEAAQEAARKEFAK